MGGSYKKNNGYKVEHFVKKYFDSYIGIETKTKGFFYDLLVNNRENNKSRKIEIKSTNLLIKNGYEKVSYGRFYFDEKNLILMKKNKVDICFVVCIKNKFEILGFCNIKQVEKNLMSKKYITLKKLLDLRLIRKENYINKFY